MQAGAINSRSNWEHFMKLAQQARTRNSGFSQNVSSNRISTVAEKVQQRAVAEETIPIPSIRGTSGGLYSVNNTNTNIRILGGKFDAWA